MTPQTTMSMFDLFMQATLVVKLVMLGLMVTSIWSWAIIIDKWISFRKILAEMEEFEQQFWSTDNWDDLYQTASIQTDQSMQVLFIAIMREWQHFRSASRSSVESVGNFNARLSLVVESVISRESENFSERLPILATIGSATPFVGLFGTIWGIMSSFASIAATQNVSLATVAPGISEALTATAIGLVAAIPAVIGYNKLNHDAGIICDRLEVFANELNAVLLREIEHKG